MLRAIGRLWLWVFGWEVEGVAPAVPRAVFVAAPHTTGWDLPFTLAVAWAMGMKVSWVGKHLLFQGPQGWFFRALGGVPVVRDQKLSQVQRIAGAMRAQERIFLIIAPSGSRARQTHWKSGFLHIAREAGAPILLAFLDYSRKRGGLGPVFTPTGNLTADMDVVRAFYKDVKGKYPHRHGVPRLAEEDAAQQAAPVPAP